MFSKILVTGCAGFIGFHLTRSLLKDGYDVIGIDNINDYYDVNLKFDRLRELGIDRNEIDWNISVSSKKFQLFRFIRINLEDKCNLKDIYEKENFDIVINLAAQAGVRYSLVNPEAYIQSNILGFLNVLELCRSKSIKHLIYASSSSVYGLNERLPFSEEQSVNHPASLYAASKKTNELMAHTYSHLYGLPTTGLRFFTVYGPWGRPDMAMSLFADAIINSKKINVFNQGGMKRDFTFIDDIISGILKVMDQPATSNQNWDGNSPDPSTSKAPYSIYNIGSSNPVELMDFIKEIERATGKTAIIEKHDLQKGDVVNTWAEIGSMYKKFSFLPQISIEEGVGKFISWYKSYYEESI